MVIIPSTCGDVMSDSVHRKSSSLAFSLVQCWCPALWQTMSCNSLKDPVGPDDIDAVSDCAVTHSLLNNGDSICEQVINICLLMSLLYSCASFVCLLTYLSSVALAVFTLCSILVYSMLSSNSFSGLGVRMSRDSKVWWPPLPRFYDQKFPLCIETEVVCCLSAQIDKACH